MPFVLLFASLASIINHPRRSGKRDNVTQGRLWNLPGLLGAANGQGDEGPVVRHSHAPHAFILRLKKDKSQLDIKGICIIVKKRIHVVSQVFSSFGVPSYINVVHFTCVYTNYWGSQAAQATNPRKNPIGLEKKVCRPRGILPLFVKLYYIDWHKVWNVNICGMQCKHKGF